MSKKNLTFKEALETIKSELDIAVMLDNIFEKKLWNSDSEILNKHLIEGTVEFDFDVKGNYTFVTCPLHDTKNADSSFYYHDKNEFMCKAGDCRSGMKTLNPIDLYMVLVKNAPIDLLNGNKEDFTETVQELADMIGITWEYSKRTLTPEELLELKKQRIRQETSEIYHNEFLKDNKWSNEARDFFLIERGFGQIGDSIHDFIKEYKIGFAGGKYGSKYIYNIMKRKGYTDEELLYSGVVQYKVSRDKETNKSVKTDEIIDFLSGRLIVPYHKGKKIDHAYGRRIEFKEKLDELYSNMTDEQIRKHKSGKHFRFKGGVDEPINFQEAKKYESLIFVEGEMDWLTFSALGFKNAVAVGGTNGLSRSDVKLLKYQRNKTKHKMCNTIYLCFDQDEPGQVAMEKIGPLFVEEGFDVRVIRISEGDPNDYLKKYGKDAKEKFDELIENAISYSAFVTLQIINNSKNVTFADKKGALQKAREHLKMIEKDELLFIACEVVEALNADTPKIKHISIEWLLHAWDLVPNPTINEPENFENAVRKPWIVVTEDAERFEAFTTNGLLDNVIFAPDMKLLIEKLKDYPHIKNITIDYTMSDTSKKILLKELAGFKFQVFIGKDNNFIKNATAEELISLFRKIDTSKQKVS